MMELVFPVAGAMLIFFVVVPLLTIAARRVAQVVPVTESLWAQQRPWRVLLVVGPTLVPLIWLISASIHQAEDGAPLAACVVEHLGGEVCRDVVLFGLILFAILGSSVVLRARRVRRAIPTVIAAAEPARSRVHSVCLQNSALAGFVPRIRVVEKGFAPACTRGLFRPWVEIEAGLVMRLDDEELEATLLHELEHAQAHDPLRFFVAQVALSINPVGRMLTPEFARYHLAREALCDKRAVQRGADPLALARSIVSVASPMKTPASVVALGGHGIDGVRLRVQLLLSYAARCPGQPRRRPPMDIATSLVIVIAAAPHFTGTGPLNVFHLTIERVGLVLGLG